jgi:hypothetical protein
MFLKKITFLLCFAALLAACSPWDEVKVEKGGYAIEFPGPPVDTSQIEGLSLAHKMYYKEMPGAKNSYYSVTYIDIPSVMDSSKLIDVCEWARASYQYDMILFSRMVGGNLHNDSVIISMAGLPAREFKVDFGDQSGTVTVRKLCSGKRIYTIMVITRANALNNESIKKFFDSFRLLN